MSQAEALQTEAPVQSSLVIEEDRMRFLPKHFGPSYLRGENLLYAWARRLSPEYSGGHWLFFELDNGGFYAAPANEGELYVCFNENSYEGHMGAEAFGIVVTLYVLCRMSYDDRTGRFTNAYHALRRFALQHPEQREIFRAID
ncbi:antirestriction protein [Burkholderia orbicola]|uniref:antirestriction protein n=1 Tax=Burkholderia orbicola TaxID=2978683 RepID=UPI00265518E9|nr:antirestriction protein [Burkholderia orbicola]MDN7472613.1 antirestriction protein [Burkholderia orbicola]MDN7507483.1 antirestriction protein [Burkholderia orbicola]